MRQERPIAAGQFVKHTYVGSAKVRRPYFPGRTNVQNAGRWNQ